MVRVLSTLALKGAVGSLAARFEAEGGARIDADFAPTLALLERLRGGEGADVVILTKEALDDLAAKGTVVAASCADLARSFVGIAVKAGAPHPDIATEAALRATLLGARSVAYSRLGASGIFFAQLIERMGIATDINAPCENHSARLYRRTAGVWRGGPRGAADQRIEAGRGRRDRRADPARAAKPGGVFRRPSGGIEQPCAIRPAPEVPGLAGGGAGAARVRAGALNLPALRSNLWAS